jgi:alginate O-acetyltransferase complex protein AlgI
MNEWLISLSAVSLTSSSQQMLFNSVTFLLFFTVFFILYWAVNNKLNVTARNAFTIVSSYLFYGWWDWRFLSLIAFSSVVDFSIGLALKKQEKKRLRKVLLYLSVTVNLGILATFKYFNFFIESLTEFAQHFSVHLNSSTLNIVLPVGISFYTFQTLSYTIDIYRKRLNPTQNVISFFAFVSFFPQLVAGPIERASNLLRQFEGKKKFNYNLCIQGLRLTLWGLFKKVVIADNFGVLADSLFATSDSYSGVSILAGSLFFALQIYADFSGYSDIAIGISKCLGYELKANFRTPYFAKSLNEFWQRWHISLSTWFRDYVYIPLGGNRKNPSRVHFNIFTTFFLSGLWHGANTTFIIWGVLHGLALITEKLIPLKLNKWLAWPLVMGLVVLFWIPFRAESTSHLFEMTRSITDLSSYSIGTISTAIESYSMNRFVALIVVSILFLAVEWNMNLVNFSNWIEQKSKPVRVMSYYALLFSILILGNFTVKPSFIYFQF